MFLHKSPQVFKWIYPSLVWNLSTREKKIYLTFDDGPIPEVTPWVLDQLDAFQAKATFFCVGENIMRHQEILLDIINRGHNVGNHTYNHLNGWRTEKAVYLENVAKTDEILERLGHSNNLFRPPYGRLRSSQIRKLKSKRIIMWDVLTGDFSQKLKPKDILEASITSTEPGSIVVFHDHEKAFENLRAVLPKYLAHFASQGYQFKPL